MSVDPSTGERWALVEEPPHGLAHALTTLYGAACLRENGLSFNTQLRHLGAVAIALDWAAGKQIDLEQRILACDMLERGEVHDLRKRLRRNFNLDKARSAKARRAIPRAVSAATHADRIRAVHAYMVWHAENAIRRIPSANSSRLRVAKDRFAAFGKMMLSALPSGKSNKREGLAAEERAAFFAAIAPDSPENPFKPPYRRRNHAMLSLLFETGCRRGELLKLTVDDLHLHGPRTFVVLANRQDEPDDPRPNEPRPKTLAREVDISSQVAAILHQYVVHDRSKLPGAKRSRFVFLARHGKPLSLQAVNDMFRLLRARAQELPNSLTPHVIRHDWNDRFSEASDEIGLAEAEEKQARNYAMGWKKGSEQSADYLVRRTREKATEVSLRMQDKSFGEGK